MLSEATAYKKDWQKAQRARLKDECDEDSFVYVHLRERDGQPFYVGIGFKETRPWETKREYNKWHTNVVAKNGVRVEIIADSLTWEQACFWEVRWIKALKTAGYKLTNLTDGGEGVKGLKWTEEKKKEHKETLNSPETVAKRNATNNSIELKELRSANTAETWKDEKTRLSRCEGIKKALQTENYKANRAEADARPEVKARRSAANKEAQNRPEVKTIKRKRAIEQWECPEKKQRHKRAMENPEVGRKISEKKTGKLRTDAQKLNIRAGQQAFQNSRTAEEKAASSAKANETKKKNGTLRPNRTTEENQISSRKGWETRRRNQLLKEEK